MLDLSQVFDGTVSPVAGAAITTTRVSTNTIDLLVARDLGAGLPLGIHVDILTAFAGGTSLQISLQVSSAAAGTYYAILLSPVMPVAQLIAGAPIFRYPIVHNEVLNAAAGVLNAPGRYLQLNYTVVGTFTAGTVFSYITPAEDRVVYYSYPIGYTVATTAGEI
jgi:hypothetical protein